LLKKLIKYRVEINRVYKAPKKSYIPSQFLLHSQPGQLKNALFISFFMTCTTNLFFRRVFSPKRVLCLSICFCALTGSPRVFAQAEDENNQLRLAQAFEQAGEIERAVPLYQELFMRNQANFVYFDGLRRCLILTKRYDGAIALSLLKIKNDPGDLGARTALGGILYRADREAAADSVWNAVIAINPRNPSLYQIVAAAQSELRLFDKMVQTYQLGRRESGNQLLFSSELASLYAMMMNYSAATREYLAMLRTTESQLDYVESRLALMTGRADALSAALHEVEMESVAAPDNIVLLRLLSWLYVEAKDFQSAYKTIAAIEDRLRSGGTELVVFADRAFRESAYRIAAVAYRRALFENPQAQFVPQVRYSIAFCVEMLSDRADTAALEELPVSHRQAAALYQVLAGLYPGSTIAVQSLYRTAIIRHKRFFDLNGAMRMLDSAAAIVPAGTMKADIALMAGDVFIVRNDLDAATIRYQSIISMQSAAETQRTQALFQLAEIEYYRHHFDTAMARLSDLAKTWTSDESNDALLLNYFITENKDAFSAALELFADADLLERQSKQGEAIAAFNLVREKYPAAPLADDALLRAGDLYAAIRQYTDALRSYKLLLHEYPVSSLREKVSYRIADVYEWGTHEKEKALQAYEDFLALYPQSLYVEEVRKRARLLRGDTKE
jgi:tetratricopeptide (TPR) repeat protein